MTITGDWKQLERENNGPQAGSAKVKAIVWLREKKRSDMWP